MALFSKNRRLAKYGTGEGTYLSALLEQPHGVIECSKVDAQAVELCLWPLGLCECTAITRQISYAPAPRAEIIGRVNAEVCEGRCSVEPRRRTNVFRGDTVDGIDWRKRESVTLSAVAGEVGFGDEADPVEDGFYVGEGFLRGGTSHTILMPGF